jgi:gluconate:H+ symporter, GntP family
MIRKSGSVSPIKIINAGMPLFDALLLLISVVVLVATPWRRLDPFLAIVTIAAAFGLTAGFTVAFVGKTFGSGFAQAIASPGLVIVAAGFVLGLAEATGAAGWLAALAARWRFLGSTWLAALAGAIGGLAATPSTAFALLTPLLRTTGGEAAPATTPHARPLTLALAISASHGLLLVSPVPIAAASILDAAWSRVFLFGLPSAALSVVVGALWAHRFSGAHSAPQPTLPASPAAIGKPGTWAAAVLLVATIVPLLLLMVQSLGDIPSEPLGGGMAREAVIGVGRPLVLLVAGVGIMVIGNLRLGGRLLADAAWTTRILGNVAGPLLTVGAAGGLQRLCQETGMAELLGERLSLWDVTGFAALLMAFLIAATIKTLQGSSLVAAITAAGIVQPLLVPLGLGGDNAKALAALAVGAGAMTVSHINDEFFWLVSVSSGQRPARTIGALSGGTLVQGVVVIGALLILAAMGSGN